MSKTKDHHHDEIEKGMRRDKRRIVFVGIHNKPGMKPLDSKSKSGMLIDRIITQLNDTTWIKSNLIDLDYLPNPIDPWQSVSDWIMRTDYNCNTDIVVCLGQDVQKTMKPFITNTVNIPHPSIAWSNKSKAVYVQKALEKIFIK